jgi:hypothetical protein
MSLLPRILRHEHQNFKIAFRFLLISLGAAKLAQQKLVAWKAHHFSKLNFVEDLIHDIIK